MILTGLLLAAGTFVVAAVVTAFWDELRDWLVSSLKVLIKKVRGIVHGVKVFVEKLHRAYKEVSKTYYQDQRKKWHETTQTREISENEVPTEILAKASRVGQAYDITDQFEHELELTY